MEASKQRKVLFILLAAGALALVVDRFVLGGGSVGGPADASASIPAPSGPSASSTPGQPGTVVTGQAGGRAPGSGPLNPPLLHRMRELPEARDYERVARLDAFKPPAAWIPEPVIEVVEPEPEPDRRAQQFEQAHRLTAIMTGAAGDIAVIGGHTVRLGQELDGFTLVALETRAAIFRAGMPGMDDVVEVRLTLPEPAGSRQDRK